jgi:hypothetical protein
MLAQDLAERIEGALLRGECRKRVLHQVLFSSLAACPVSAMT